LSYELLEVSEEGGSNLGKKGCRYVRTLRVEFFYLWSLFKGRKNERKTKLSLKGSWI